MNRILQKRIEKKLLDEVDSIFQKHYRLTLEEVITELRMRCVVAHSTSEPRNILIDLYRSGIFNYRSDSDVRTIRNTIGKLEKETFGLCAGCRDSIPEEWLVKNPFVEYCPYCMIRLRMSSATTEERIVEKA